MSTKTIVKRKAEDFKAGMQLWEVQRFLAETWGSPGTPGPIRCAVNLRGGIKELSVEVVTDD